MVWGNEWMQWGLNKASATLQRDEAQGRADDAQRQQDEQSALSQGMGVLQSLFARNADRDARMQEMMWKEKEGARARAMQYTRDAMGFDNDRTQELARAARAKEELKFREDREDQRDTRRGARETARMEFDRDQNAKERWNRREIARGNQEAQGARLNTRILARMKEAQTRSAKDPMGAYVDLQKIIAGDRQSGFADTPQPLLDLAEKVREDVIKRYGMPPEEVSKQLAIPGLTRQQLGQQRSPESVPLTLNQE